MLKPCLRSLTARRERPGWRVGQIFLLSMLAVSPAAADDPYILDLDSAVALREQLEDDVLVLTRIRGVQESLITLNALRHKRGLAPVTLATEICLASPLAQLCPDLPATFSRSEP